MEFLLIRHGQTAGNLTGSYIGASTDEPLCPTGIYAIKALALARSDLLQADKLYISPMCRCAQTAALLFPGLSPVVIEEFRECNFGVFEGKCFRQLEHDPRYRIWVEGGCTGPIPEGEHPNAFRTRCQAAFAPLLTCSNSKRTALVVHGGTIMAILAAFALPEQDYFSYQVPNGAGYLCCAEEGHLTILERV